MVTDQHLLLGRDGASVPIEGEASPVLDPNGRLTGVVLVWRSVAERKRAEEARARVAALVESAADAIIGTDLNGIILSWNPTAEQLFGYSAAEVMGQQITMLAPPGLEHEEQTILGQIRRGERVEFPETIRRHKDGTQVDVC